MISDIQYESSEEMEKCRGKAIIAIKKLHKKLGFVVFEAAEEVNLSRKSPQERRNYYQNRARGGSSY